MRHFLPELLSNALFTVLTFALATPSDRMPTLPLQVLQEMLASTALARHWEAMV